MSTQSKNMSVAAQLNNIIKGVESNFPDTASITIDGITYDKPSLLAVLKAKLAQLEAADVAFEIYKQKLAEREAAMPDTDAFKKRMCMALLAYYGSNTSTLAEYGVSPRKARRKLTSEEKVVAATKAKKTREMRGTLGPKAKAKLKAAGQVTVTTRLDSPPATDVGTSPASDGS
jgi:hypothetical protein